MSIVAVGVPGSVTSPGSATASPAFPQPTTAGNLLIAVVKGRLGTGANITCSDGTWTQAVQSLTSSGTGTGVAIFYKANCGAGETAPTFTWTGATGMNAALEEFSAAAVTSVLDQTASASGTTSPLVATAAGADAYAGGALVITVSAFHYSVAATNSSTDTLNNGAAKTDLGNNDATSVTSHYRFTRGLTTGNGSADSNSCAFTTTNVTDARTVLASFKTPPWFSDVLAGSLTLSGSRVESAAISDSPSGTLTISGALVEAATISDILSGSLSLSGALVEASTISDILSGTLTLSGSRTEAASISDVLSGALTLSGSRVESASISDILSGAMTLSGVIVESASISDVLSGTISLGGAMVEASSGSDVVTGTMAFSGSIIEALLHLLLAPDSADVIVIHADGGDVIALLSPDVTSNPLLIVPDS